MSDDGGETYNKCHCEFTSSWHPAIVIASTIVWSNFEIADMDFWRGPAYTAFFDYLDSKGGFYYEVRLHSQTRLLSDSLSGNSVGEMHRYIVWLQGCSREKIRYSSSTKSDMSTAGSRTAHRVRTSGLKGNVHVIRRRVSVRLNYDDLGLDNWHFTDVFDCRLWWIFLHEQVGPTDGKINVLR